MKNTILFIFIVLFFQACQKESIPELNEDTSLQINTLERGKNIAQVKDYFVRLLGNGATTSLIEPDVFGYSYNNSFSYNLNCTTTSLGNNGSSLQIEFDSTGNCLLPNGAKMHGELIWDLNFNDYIVHTRECQPAFLRFDRLYIDGCVVEELRDGVASPKFFFSNNCPDTSTIATPTSAELDFNFRVSGSKFDYRVTTPEGQVTIIDPLASPGIFATMTTNNDFDSDLNIQDLYEREYKISVPLGDNITFCPFTKVYVYEPGNNSNSPDDSYAINTTSPMIYHPFQCKYLTSGFLELRQIPNNCTGNSTLADAPLQTTVDFSVDASGISGVEDCDSFVKICDYTINPNSPDCKIISYE